MDDFEKSLQKALKDPKFSYIWGRVEEENEDNSITFEMIQQFGKEWDEAHQSRDFPEIINSASIATPTLVQILKDTPTLSFVEFEKENKQAKKLKDNVWEIDGKRFTMPGLLKFLNITNTQKIEEDIEMDKDNKILRDRIRSQIERLEKNDLLVYDVAAGFGFNKLFVRINNLHPEYYTIWNENDDGEVANLTKYSDIENVIDWIIKDATSYTPKLYKNKYIRMEEEWDYGDSNINYIDIYVWKDDTQDNIEFNEVTAALKEFLQSDFTDYESLIELELVPWEEKKGYFKIIPIFGEVDLAGYTIPAYELLNKGVEKDYNLSEIEREYVQDAREKLINDIEEINRKLPELRSWGFKKYKTGEKFNTSLINEGWSYKDKYGLEVVDLEYYDLPYEAYYGPMDWETGVGKNYVNTTIPSYVYTVDKQDIEEFFANFLYEKDPEYTSIEDDEKEYEYISQNFDNLMDKYYDDVLEEFKEDAIEDAYNKYSPEDFEYYPD